MPHPITTTLLVLAAIFTVVSGPGAVAVAGVALGWECFMFYVAGSSGG